ncbi:MAG: SOS response-associated peptidase [Geothrix sp.]|nr:SOS response-associated peptidase [Geothrix sp.]
MVAIALKKLAALEGKGRTVRDLVTTYTDRYNLAPSQQVVTVHQDGGEWVFSERTWGMAPPWVSRPLINAMAETVAQKPTFRRAFQSGRLLVPVSGYYEWATIAGRKRPFYIHPAGCLDGTKHWWFAGRGETQKTPDGPGEAFAVITTPANRNMAELHHRMPAILDQASAASWLDPTTSQADLQALLRPCPDDWIEAFEVGAAVGNVRNDSPELIFPRG